MRSLSSSVLALGALATLTAHATAAPKSYKGVLSNASDQARFERFIRANIGKTVRLTLTFTRYDNSGKTRYPKGAVTTPYGYKGSESLAIFGIGDRTYWLQGIPDGRRWEDAVGFKDAAQTFTATFRVSKNKRAGGGKWYDLTLKS